MEFIDLLKHLPAGGGATYISLALFALWGLYKLGMRYLSIMERKSEREAKILADNDAAARQERKEALEREHGREAVHREATAAAIKRLNDSVVECETDRKNLRTELEESRKFFARDLDCVKRNVKSIADQLVAVKSQVGTTLADAIHQGDAASAEPAKKAKSARKKAK